jgi:hypothetical protein
MVLAEKPVIKQPAAILPRLLPVPELWYASVNSHEFGPLTIRDAGEISQSVTRQDLWDGWSNESGFRGGLRWGENLDPGSDLEIQRLGFIDIINKEIELSCCGSDLHGSPSGVRTDISEELKERLAEGLSF